MHNDDIRELCSGGKVQEVIIADQTGHIKTHGSVLCGQESWQPHREYIDRKKENSFFMRA